MTTPLQWPLHLYPAVPYRLMWRIAPGATLADNPNTYPWIDISGDIDETYTMREKCGSADEQSETSSELQFTLKNTDGRYTSDDPRSELWPNFDVGCPVDLIVDIGQGFNLVWRGYIASLTDDWPDETPYRCVTHVTASGMFRRMGNDLAITEALRTAVQAQGPVHYWPMDDGQYASSLTPLVGGIPLSIVGSPELASVGGLPGSAGSFPKTMSAGGKLGGFRADLPGTRSATQWTVEIWFQPGVKTADPDGYLGSIRTSGGTVQYFEVEAYDSGGGGVVSVYVWGAGFATIATATSLVANIFDGGWHRVRVTATQVGANFTASVQLDDQAAQAATGGALTGQTIGRIARFEVGDYEGLNVNGNNSTDIDSLAIGQVSIYDGTPTSDGYQAGIGYPGEAAHTRIGRVAGSLGLSTYIQGSSSALQGPQPIDSPLGIFRDSEATDHGILTDHGGVVGYRTLSDMINQTPKLVIDGAGRELFFPYAPTRDDQGRRNRIKVKRVNGGEITVQDSASILRHGVYDADIPELNISSDDVLTSHGQYFLTLGTQEGKRIGQITVRAQAAPQLAAPLLLTSLGDVIRIDNPPKQARRGSQVFLVRGRESVFAADGRTWVVTFNVIRADPFYEMLLDTDRVDSADHTIAGSALDAVPPGTSQSISVAAPTVLATVDPTDFPLDVDVGAIPGGERMRVTSISGASSPQTWTVTRGIDGAVRRHAVGTPVRLWQPPLLGMG